MPVTANWIAVNAVSSAMNLRTERIRYFAATGSTRNDQASVPKIAKNQKALDGQLARVCAKSFGNTHAKNRPWMTMEASPIAMMTSLRYMSNCSYAFAKMRKCQK
jgi:hypothetical protein